MFEVYYVLLYFVMFLNTLLVDLVLFLIVGVCLRKAISRSQLSLDFIGSICGAAFVCCDKNNMYT